MSNLRDRAFAIERIIERDYLADVDAADLALEELHRDSNRSDEVIANQVAMLIQQA
jgi:hypothetical protein